MLWLTQKVSNKTKALRILKHWKMGKTISILQMGPDVNHFEASANEFAAIKAIGLENLSNCINGCSYGVMSKWHPFLTHNYGIMLLYNTLVQAILVNPPKISYTDFFVKT